MISRRTISIVQLVGAAVLLVLVIGFATPTRAITLDDYKARVDTARRLATDAENLLRNDATTDSKTRELIAQIRKNFSASDRIDWDGGTVETSNNWLLDRARALEEDPDRKNQLPIVSEIREQLTAIAFKMQELDQAIAAERTKDQDKQKLAEILRREEYQKPTQKEESVFQKWLAEFLQWLESIFPKPSGASQGGSDLGFLTAVLQIALYGGLFALLGFLVYKLAPLLFPKLRRTARPKKKKDRVILGEQLGEDVTSHDLFAEAERLAREGNSRGAIRKGYIALLCDLSDRKVIGLARNKTNRDYLRDIRSRRELHPRMKSVTDMFERHWYGFQDSAEQDWARFREEYHETIRSV